MRQIGNLNQIIWKTPRMIAFLSECIVLAPGDLIFAGTSAGVGAIQRRQTIEAKIDGVGDSRVTVI